MALQAFLRGEPAPFTAYQLTEQMEMTSSMVQEAIGLEREVTNYWLALFFQEEKKQNRTYSAIMLTWIRSVGLLPVSIHRTHLLVWLASSLS